jgi:hypothetical protein
MLLGWREGDGMSLTTIGWISPGGVGARSGCDNPSGLRDLPRGDGGKFSMVSPIGSKGGSATAGV